MTLPPDSALAKLELTVRTRCPVLCEFCPQDVLTANTRHTDKKVMQARDLHEILNNVSRVRPARIIFAGFAEPFSVPNVDELLATCQAHKGVARITVYTTGEGLTPGLIELLAGLDKLYPDEGESSGNRYINFHVRHPSNYSMMKGARGEIWHHVPRISRLFPKSRFVCVTEGHTEAELSEMHSELAGYGFSLTTRELESRSGNLTELAGRPLKHNLSTQPVTCCKVHPQMMMPVVLPNGAAYACCNDYGLELPIGNLLTDTWEDLDFSDIMNDQQNPGSLSPCFRDCHLAEPAPHFYHQSETSSSRT